MGRAVYFALLAVLLGGAEAIDNGQALTPPRGFSTWNAFSFIGIDEATCYRYMNGLVKHGLNKLNYTYFIVDEPCFVGRDAKGRHRTAKRITEAHGACFPI
jgi:hypothetical protein